MPYKQRNMIWWGLIKILSIEYFYWDLIDEVKILFKIEFKWFLFVFILHINVVILAIFEVV